MAKKLKLSELGSMLSDLDVEALEGVHIEGDIELELDSMGGLNPQLSYMLGQETAQIAQHLINISRLLGYPVDQLLGATGLAATPGVMRPQELLRAKFQVNRIEEWKNPIQEVTFGATSSDGGTRKSTVTVGGENALPYYFDSPMPHRNHITMDVFDMPIGMAKAVKVNYEDVIESPAEWAKKVVNDFGADMVTIHLISTDPMIKDLSLIHI